MAERQSACRFDLAAIVGQREQTFTMLAYEPIERRGGDGVADQPVQDFPRRVAADLRFQLDVAGATDHRALQRRTLHRVEIVLDKADVVDGDMPLAGQRQDLVHRGGDHAGGEERQRARRLVQAVQIGALVAGEPPDGAGAGGGDQRLLLHDAQRADGQPHGFAPADPGSAKAYIAGVFDAEEKRLAAVFERIAHRRLPEAAVMAEGEG